MREKSVSFEKSIERLDAIVRSLEQGNVPLEQALKLRLYANINRDEILREGNRLIYRTLDCRVQTARSRKGMEWHPCKPVGETEYGGFAKVIDDRITCRALSCYPSVTDDSCACSWEFTLNG